MVQAHARTSDPHRAHCGAEQPAIRHHLLCLDRIGDPRRVGGTTGNHRSGHRPAADLPVARHDSGFVWLVRIVLLIFIFVYAFFVFTWSIRQYNFCAVLVGAAPHTEKPEEHEGFLDTITDVASYAAENFNLGLRAYYFALAAMTWFLHPWLFAAASALVAYVLHEREFRSQTLQTLTRRNSILQSLYLPEAVARKPRPGSDAD